MGNMEISHIVGAVIGAVSGGGIGFWGKRSGSTWGITASPWVGALFGSFVGLFIAASFFAR